MTTGKLGAVRLGSITASEIKRSTHGTMKDLAIVHRHPKARRSTVPARPSPGSIRSALSGPELFERRTGKKPPGRHPSAAHDLAGTLEQAEKTGWSRAVCKRGWTFPIPAVRPGSSQTGSAAARLRRPAGKTETRRRCAGVEGACRSDREEGKLIRPKNG